MHDRTLHGSASDTRAIELVIIVVAFVSMTLRKLLIEIGEKRAHTYKLRDSAISALRGAG